MQKAKMNRVILSIHNTKIKIRHAPSHLFNPNFMYLYHLEGAKKKKSFQVQHQRPAIEPALGSVGSWVGSAPGESTPAPTILLPISSLPL